MKVQEKKVSRYKFYEFMKLKRIKEESGSFFDKYDLNKFHSQR
jgi:hypothetical protein